MWSRNPVLIKSWALHYYNTNKYKPAYRSKCDCQLNCHHIHNSASVQMDTLGVHIKGFLDIIRLGDKVLYKFVAIRQWLSWLWPCVTFFTLEEARAMHHPGIYTTLNHRYSVVSMIGCGVICIQQTQVWVCWVGVDSRCLSTSSWSQNGIESWSQNTTTHTQGEVTHSSSQNARWRKVVEPAAIVLINHYNGVKYTHSRHKGEGTTHGVLARWTTQH